MIREAANRRINLTHHRIVARALRADPALIEEARAVVGVWSRGTPYPPLFVREWRRLLSSSADVVGREIVHHAPDAERLRGSSPFALTPSQLLTRDQVRRLWRMSAFHAMRLLQPSEYPDYGAHLKKLNNRDRTLRFCRPVSDKWIDAFIRTIVTDEESVVIGHYDAALGLDGALFIALIEREEGRFAETGLSVLPEARHRGIGYHLLERGLLWARNRSASRFYSLCATGNEIMFKLARAHRMDISFTDEGVEGCISLNPLSLRSLSREILEDQIGEWDFNLKAHHTAFSFVMARPLPEHAAKTDMERLVQLAAVGRTDVIANYVIVFRYALIQSGASGEDHAASLAKLRAKLEPLVARDSGLWTFAKGLPAAGQGNHSRYGLRRPVLAHGTSAPAKRDDCSC